eukprot:6210526-Pleurochrysis_carterae.AAC.2
MVPVALHHRRSSCNARACAQSPARTFSKCGYKRPQQIQESQHKSRRFRAAAASVSQAPAQNAGGRVLDATSPRVQAGTVARSAGTGAGALPRRQPLRSARAALHWVTAAAVEARERSSPRARTGAARPHTVNQPATYRRVSIQYRHQSRSRTLHVGVNRTIS